MLDAVKTLVLVVSVVHVVVSLPVPKQDHPLGDRTLGLSELFPQYMLCEQCKLIVNLAISTIASNGTFDYFKAEAVCICKYITEFLNYRGDLMCPGLIDAYGPVVLFVAAHLILDPVETCRELHFCEPKLSPLSHKHNLLLESQDAVDSAMMDSEDQVHSMTLDRQETSVYQFHKEPIKIRDRHGAVSDSSDPIRIVQIADIHIDRQYAEGSPTDCRMNICCKKELSGSGSAGKFGDYNCDAPPRTVETILSHIAALDPQPDFVIYTGDSPPHDLWEESWSTQFNADLDVINIIKSYLPEIAVYPVLGNHESFPQSEYYQPHQEYKTLNIKTAEGWQQLFDIPADQLKNIQYSAYYTTLVQPGLRILSINTDYWYSLNFYSLLNHKVPAYEQQLKFIDETLRNASDHNEKVIITGHIPPGEFWVQSQYGDIYTEIIRKYADVIAMNVFSHTHHDEFELITDPSDTSRPTGVVFVAPSVTTQAKTNPSFRVYKLDRETFQVQDYDQYYIDLTKANAEGVATLQMSYSARSEYNLPDLSPQSYHSLVHRLATDRSLFDRYMRNKYVKSGQDPECCFLCRQVEICRISSITTSTYNKCLIPFL
ncbi:sphingomyelin phosphodiesterase A-like [Haliotis rufescens]|uniref:sphingomyelin phosphodiesterase A-like n=1 Tax=Haliotis rufescens TaxID=6454 RepID=UPI00201FA86A|nr:sphingomyelin phosphodiesterase A-like [Haliotis rufescens]